MKWLCPVVLAAAVVLNPAGAFAQTPAAAAPSNSGPMMTVWYAGINTGVTLVDGAGALFGGEVGMRTWRNLDISAEGGWFQNVATSKRKESATLLAGFLQTTQGQPATADVKMPVAFLGVNARWVFESERRVRPYVLAGIGGARVNVNSEFTLGSSDVTDSLPQYGVTLGQDLTGHSSSPAFTFGGGVLVPYGKWYVDGGYRVTTIAGDETITVHRLNIGFGARF
jgi:opacity protein-like surface antigen